MIRCKYCESDKTVKAGKHKSEKYGVGQMYLCKDCGKRFIEDANAPRYSDSFKEHVVRSVVFEGLGIRQASRVFNIITVSIINGKHTIYFLMRGIKLARNTPDG